MTYIPRTLGIALLLLAILPFSTVQARETPSQRLLKREITFFIKRSDYPRTMKAIEIYSRRQRRTIYRSDAGLLLHPASNLKIVTTSFALENLTDSYLFTTPFEFSGRRRSDTLSGDLVVVGMGDPILSYDDLDSAARAISMSGIRSITGNIVINVSKFDSLQWGNGWMWDDEPQPYAMFISPATFNHETVTVLLTLDSTRSRMVVTTQPATDFVKIRCEAVQGDTDSVNVTRVMLHGVNTILTTGTYTTGFQPDTFQFSVRHPAEYFGTVFKELLEKEGISVQGKVVVSRDNVGTKQLLRLFAISHSIDSVVTFTNKNSDNLGAECLLRTVPMAMENMIGSAQNGIAMGKNFLDSCGVDSTEYYIVDGSGVSHYDLITPGAIVKVLRHNLDQPYAAAFVHSLPISGEDGTLEDRMTEDYVKGSILGKTGSISGVSTLSGYVLLPRDTLVFSMMVQNFIGSSDSLTALQDSICSVMSQYNSNARIFARNLRRHRIGTYALVHNGRRVIRKRKEAVRSKVMHETMKQSQLDKRQFSR